MTLTWRAFASWPFARVVPCSRIVGNTKYCWESASRHKKQAVGTFRRPESNVEDI